MPQLFGLLKIRSAQKIAELAGVIALGARPHIPRHVEKRLARMTYSEARGYLRAFATPIVEEIGIAEDRQRPIPAALAEEVLDRALKMVVDRILADQAMSPPREARRAA
jgi:hypothetical protein